MHQGVRHLVASPKFLEVLNGLFGLIRPFKAKADDLNAFARPFLVDGCKVLGFVQAIGAPGPQQLNQGNAGGGAGANDLTCLDVFEFKGQRGLCVL